MKRGLRWGGKPEYTPETGFPPPGGFRKNRGLEREIAERGIKEGVSVRILGDRNTWEVAKVHNGKIILRRLGTKEKEVGLGAIEKVL